MKRFLFSCVSCLVWLGCLFWGGNAALSQPPELFHAQLHQVPAGETGIDFQHTDGGTGAMYITETVVGGLATLDYDGDGRVDIYFVNGASIEPNAPKQPTNRLYRNLGNWKFEDVTLQAGVGGRECGMGAVVADYDNDGDPDLFVTNYGDNVFYENNGDGTFDETTVQRGLSSGVRFGAGAAFFDMDGDGNLDLYTASYVDFRLQDHRTRTIAGHQFPSGPNDYPPAPDFLYRNLGQGGFKDVSEKSGIAQPVAPGMGVLAADFDGDLDTDILVANDQSPNTLFLNDGKGRFQESGFLAGLAVDIAGRANGNMGLDYADLDGDGMFDVLTTTFQEEMPVLYRAAAEGIFEDATNLARIDRALNNHVNWGCGAVDFDNDADNDIFLACGHFLENLRFIDDRTTVNTPNFLLANDGHGRFVNVSGSAGNGLKLQLSSRGAAFDDLDNDGDVDVVILNANGPPSLLRNDLLTPNRSLQITLIGTQCSRDAVGAVARLTAGGSTQVAVQLAGRGYESGYARRLHFGTRQATQGMLEVQWPSGDRERFKISAPHAWIIQGQSSVP